MKILPGPIPYVFCWSHLRYNGGITMDDEKLARFFELCEFYILRNLEISQALPSSTKLLNNFRYLLIFLDLQTKDEYSQYKQKIIQYLESCSYDEDFIMNILERGKNKDKLLLLFDYFESYLVDEIEKDLYGHGDKCYTSLYDSLNLVLEIKQEKYNYNYENVNDLLVKGYYFKRQDADKFADLVKYHKSDDCPD